MKGRNSSEDGAAQKPGFAASALKRAASRLPSRLQQELKRFYFSRRLRNGTFQSEENEFRRLEEWVGTGDWVLDIGANIGYYTAKLSALVGADGRVLAFEPVPETFELLASTVARLPSRNVSLFNVAASDRACLVAMSVPRFDNHANNYFMAHLTDGIGAFSVLSLAADGLGLTTKIKLAKVDVEGHELAALMGIEQIIARDLPVLIVEGRSDKVEAFLARYGYAFEQDPQSPNRVYRSRTAGAAVHPA